MERKQSWRDGDERVAVGDKMSRALDSQLRIFNSGVMGAYVGSPDFGSPLFSGALSALNGALRDGLRLMAGEGREDAPLAILYDNLREADKNALEAAFQDAVRFYGFRPELERWRHLESLLQYFDALAVPKSMMLADDGFKPELLLHHALIRYMGGMFSLGVGDCEGERPFYISEAVSREADRVWGGVVWNLSRGVDLPDVNEMMDVLRERESVIKAAAAFESGAFYVSSEFLAGSLRRFLDGMRDIMERDGGLAPGIRYALSKHGARRSDCDIADIRLEPMANGWCLVWTPGGSRMGSVAERHDGLWFGGGMVGVDRGSVVGLLVDERTRILSVLSDDGDRNLRIFRADGMYAPNEYGQLVCEVWGDIGALSALEMTEFAIAVRSGWGREDARYKARLDRIQGGVAWFSQVRLIVG